MGFGGWGGGSLNLKILRGGGGSSSLGNPDEKEGEKCLPSGGSGHGGLEFFLE